MTLSPVDKNLFKVSKISFRRYFSDFEQVSAGSALPTSIPVLLLLLKINDKREEALGSRLLSCVFIYCELLIVHLSKLGSSNDNQYPADNNLFKVSTVTLKQRSENVCSNVILLTLNRLLS